MIKYKPQLPKVLIKRKYLLSGQCSIVQHTAPIQIFLSVCHMQIAAKRGRYCGPGYFEPFISV